MITINYIATVDDDQLTEDEFEDLKEAIKERALELIIESRMEVLSVIAATNVNLPEGKVLAHAMIHCFPAMHEESGIPGESI